MGWMELPAPRDWRVSQDRWARLVSTIGMETIHQGMERVAAMVARVRREQLGRMAATAAT